MVDSLTSYGLVMVITEEEETFFCVTPRGIDFLDTYWKIKGFLASFDEKNI
ncbi:MAG: hypothetical protein JRN20_00625 [Nitrososphaerota archaeon]|nr:hypothetical protein [Nitrososphaerota archaeon]MDG6922146.1 hypothetical protein [Nitrososphaerota archaeon]